MSSYVWISHLVTQGVYGAYTLGVSGNVPFCIMKKDKPCPDVLCALLGTRHPIVQAGMVWCTGWELAAEVGKAGALGTLGAGSMYPGAESGNSAVKSGIGWAFCSQCAAALPGC